MRVEKEAHDFTKRYLMLRKKVRQISGNAPSPGIPHTHNSAHFVLILQISDNCVGVTLTLLSFGGCVAQQNKSAVAEASSRHHDGFTGNDAAVVGSVQPCGKSSVQQPELEQRTQDVYLTKAAVTNRIKKKKKEGKGELHNPSNTPPNNLESHIFGEERHGHRRRGNPPTVAANCTAFFDSSPSHSDHIRLQTCLWVCF